MEPRIDHIHVTVEDIERAERFYDRLLPLLGFDLGLKEHDCVPEHEYRIVEYHNRNFSFGIVNRRPQFAGETVSRRKAGALHHLAFRVETEAEVDDLYREISAIPATIIHRPRHYKEYCEDYYAFFFKDSEGIEYEVVAFSRDRCFS
ncbi:VOC family protein [Fretibacterium sp. OH1220_COT-178]|uniref:VOC family protein n=1 Tax=Fretibacterium sp. OH1220_COT-178 TaxID=2491047 RepID=UPI000F5D74B9|nr:VOC family protein [Fretibacterium sp. OH1220_COT-178]RRD63598.1 glyoxalase [Fretibacterium sp. OH1220_COT-178]